MKVSEILIELSTEEVRDAQRRLLRAFGSKHIGGRGDSNKNRTSGARSANTRSPYKKKE